MFRRLFLILLILSTATVFAETTASDAVGMSAMSLNQNTTFLSTGDTIKKLEAHRLEINSTLALEQQKVLEEVRQRDAVQNTLNDIDILLKEWSQINLKKIELTLLEEAINSSPELEKVTKELETRQSALAQKILIHSKLLDV